jgi:hypothetical protein
MRVINGRDIRVGDVILNAISDMSGAPIKGCSELDLYGTEEGDVFLMYADSPLLVLEVRDSKYSDISVVIKTYVDEKFAWAFLPVGYAWSVM